MKTNIASRLFERIMLYMVILIAAIMRFYNLGEMSLSNDELSSLTRIRYDSFSEMIAKGVYIDYHPAGLQTFLYFWVKIFGDGPFIIRLPFVVCSLVSIWMIYEIGKKWFNGLTAILAASSFAFLSFTILFTQLARMYSPGVMFSLLSVYCWTNFLFPSNENKRDRWLILFTISMTINLHLHYFSFLISGFIGISGLFFVKKKDLVKYISAGLFALLTFIPEIPVFIEQMKTGDIGGWLGPPSKNFIPEFFFELFNRSVIICMVISVLVLAGIFSGERKTEYDRWRLLSITWFILTFTVAYLYSIFRHPILTFSTLLFAIPFLLLTAFSFIPDFLREKKKMILTAILFSMLLIYDTAIPARHYSKKHFGVFREVAEDVHQWQNKYGQENVSIIANVINPEYVNYYFRKMEPEPKVTAYKIESPADFSSLFELAKNSSSDYFAYIWSNSAHPLEISGIIRSYYPFLIEKKNYFNASSYLFGKRMSDTLVNNELHSSLENYEEQLLPVDQGKISTEKFASPAHSEKMINEFSTSIVLRPTDLQGTGYRYANFKAWVYPVSEMENAQMVLSFDRDSKPYDYHSVLLKNFKLKTGGWQQVIISAEIPKDFLDKETLVTYFWNPSKDNFFIDDLEVKIYAGDDPYEQFFQWKRNMFY